MEQLLSNKWDNVFLNEVKQEALVNARDNDSALRDQAVYLFDNNKMASFKSDVVIVETGALNVVLVSKESFVKNLDGNFPDRASVVAKSQSFVSSVASQENAVKISGEDFSAWAEQAGLSDVVESLGLKNKAKLRM